MAYAITGPEKSSVAASRLVFGKPATRPVHAASKEFGRSKLEIDIVNCFLQEHWLIAHRYQATGPKSSHVQ
jgi:hypothetical protein